MKPIFVEPTRTGDVDLDAAIRARRWKAYQSELNDWFVSGAGLSQILSDELAKEIDRTIIKELFKSERALKYKINYLEYKVFSVEWNKKNILQI